MRHLVAALACLVAVNCVSAAEIVGPQQPARIEGVTKVRVGQPPWVKLDVLDAPEGAIVTWRGPVGDTDVGSPCAGGLKVSTALAGTYTFEAIIQQPLPGPDTIEFVKHVVVIESTIVVTPPPDNPPPDNPPPDNPPPDNPPPVGTDMTAQAKTWLATVPDSPAKAKTKTEVAKTLREVAAANVNSVDELELFLGLGLKWSIGDEAPAWASFSGWANKALDTLKASGATVAQYRAALKAIAQGIDPQ